MREVLESFLIQRGYRVDTSFDVHGYFPASPSTDSKEQDQDFVKGLVALQDRLLAKVRKKQDAGYEVFINPTAGFKAHVMVTALVGFLTQSAMYYMHEEFSRMIYLPPLLYLPEERELHVLNQLKDRTPLSGGDYRRLAETFSDELARLSEYGLVLVETDEAGQPYRVQMTRAGRLIAEKMSAGRPDR